MKPQERIVSDRCLVLYDRERPHSWRHVKYIPVHPPFTVRPYGGVNPSIETITHHELMECSNCGLRCIFDTHGKIVEIISQGE